MKLVDELPPELQVLADVALRVVSERRDRRPKLVDNFAGGDLTPPALGVIVPPMEREVARSDRGARAGRTGESSLGFESPALLAASKQKRPHPEGPAASPQGRTAVLDVRQRTTGGEE